MICWPRTGDASVTSMTRKGSPRGTSGGPAVNKPSLAGGGTASSGSTRGCEAPRRVGVAGPLRCGAGSGAAGGSTPTRTSIGSVCSTPFPVLTGTLPMVRVPVRSGRSPSVTIVVLTMRPSRPSSRDVDVDWLVMPKSAPSGRPICAPQASSITISRLTNSRMPISARSTDARTPWAEAGAATKQRSTSPAATPIAMYRNPIARRGASSLTTHAPAACSACAPMPVAAEG